VPKSLVNFVPINWFEIVRGKNHTSQKLTFLAQMALKPNWLYAVELRKTSHY